MLHEQLYCPSMLSRNARRILLLVCLLRADSLLIKVDELQCLTLDGSEKVVVADEIKDIRLADLEEVWQSFLGLSIQDETKRCQYTPDESRKLASMSGMADNVQLAHDFQ
jgi:hypothetical protein